MSISSLTRSLTRSLTIGSSNLGHSLDASYSGGVISIVKSTHPVSTVHANGAVKWVNPDVQFFDPTGAKEYARGLSYGTEFYKVSLHDMNYH